MSLRALRCVYLPGNLQVIYLKSVRPLHVSCTSQCESKKSSFVENKDVTNQVKKQLSELPEKEIYSEYHQTETGHVYDKKPVKVRCVEGKIYMWCSCGKSNHQPFCDGTHNVKHWNIKLKPIPFKCKETKDYWICNCKKTKMRPFCDGTHKEPFVQNAESTIKI